MTEIEIYSAALCPFAQRSRLTLSEKGVPFELIEIDLQNKPAGSSVSTVIIFSNWRSKLIAFPENC